MHILSIPKWVNQYHFPYQKIEDVPEKVFENINTKLKKLQQGKPLVTILIAAWNEEINILRNMASIADLETQIPLEIIIVNNNSKDNTQTTLDKLSVTSLFQVIQGCGPARQLGMENAKGKYIVLADADCVYPSCWLDDVMEVMVKPGVACVYGRYSFIPEKGFPRWQLFILEKLKDLAAELRQFNRPYLNAFGISMAYVKEYGLKVGYIMHNTRGDDGRLCFDLMQFGKVKPVRSNRARAWTAPRTLQRDGTFMQALTSRIKLEFRNLFSLATPHKPHDTKTSKNE
ncbi:glycosyltransferase family 2 protein [Pedobacter cryotolerans]|uniref:Glycosyltransferase family 2 protein n=1 Tax=Pedobacter cryotolerans TaxID=2571270 RepID=A0A4U1C378_9SPHI|nr:glycosyltransferase family 2 protein [Pedobacter cryotolerans]TKB99659.1 glycosyltransferase family 2 protein [Pedobacter cryotolerans]